jgi:hypothetical protein
MAKIIRLTESDLHRIVKRVLSEGTMKKYSPSKKLKSTKGDDEFLEKGYKDDKNNVHLYFADCGNEFIASCDKLKDLSPLPVKWSYITSEGCPGIPSSKGYRQLNPIYLDDKSQMWVYNEFCKTGNDLDTSIPGQISDRPKPKLPSQGSDGPGQGSDISTPPKRKSSM